MNEKNIIIWNNDTLTGLLKALDFCIRKLNPFHSMNAAISVPLLTAETDSGDSYRVKVFRSYRTPTAIVCENTVTGAAVIFVPDNYREAAIRNGGNGVTTEKQITRLARDAELGLVVRTGYKPGLIRLNGYRGTEYKPHVSAIYEKPDAATRLRMDVEKCVDLLGAFDDILTAVWEKLPDAIPGGNEALTEWAKSEVITRNPTEAKTA